MCGDYFKSCAFEADAETSRLMFGGIVQACSPITSIEPTEAGLRFGVAFPVPLLEGLMRGASVAVDGVCLTVTDISEQTVYFDAVPGTLARTNLKNKDAGQRVNIERSLSNHAEIGGHAISGHVEGTASLIELRTASDKAFLDFHVSEDIQKYIFPRGYVALNGCSLTIAECDDIGIYRVNLIPETLRQTSFMDYRPGDRLNIEPEARTVATVDTVERILVRMGHRI